MLSKKDKMIVGGFVAMSVVGFVGTMFLLFNPKSEQSPSEPDQGIEQVSTDLENPMHNPGDENTPANQVAFEDEEKKDLDDTEALGYLKQSEQLMLDLDFKGIVDLLEPVVRRYSLVGENGQAVADMYTDANLFLTQAEMEDPYDRASVLIGVVNPMTTAYVFAHLPTDVLLYTVMDGNSMAVSDRGEVNIRGEKVFHPTILEGDDEMNPYFKENPYISLFLSSFTHVHDMTGIYEIPLRIQGVDVTSYIAAYDDRSLLVLGYYVDNQAEFGDRFKSIDWHLAQRQRLEEAVYTNWGEKVSEDVEEEKGE